MTVKQLKEKKAELTSVKNEQYEDFCFARSKRREIQTVSTNVHAMLDQSRK